MGTLIYVETSFITIELSGHREPKAVLLNQNAWPIPQVQVDPVESETRVSKRFPFLFEEEDYTIIAQSKINGDKVYVSHRDERTIENIDRVPIAVPSTLMGPVRFRQSVGLSTFTFYVGFHAVDLTVEVFPSKLDYLSDYDAMIEDVQEFDRVLPLRYFDETYRRGAPQQGSVGDRVQWLSILRAQIGDLQRAFRYADRHPLISLELHQQTVQASHIRKVTQQVRRAVARGEGSGSWEQALPGVPIHRYIPADQSRDSLDSVEHRWLHGNLRYVMSSLSRIIQSLCSEEEEGRARWGNTPSRSNGSKSARAQQIEEITGLKSEMEALGNLSIMREVSQGHVPSSFTSLRLLRTPGYSEAYRLLTTLRLGLENIDGGIEVSVDRLGQLYEAWCFVEILRQVEALTGAELLHGLDDFISHDTLGTRLVKGKRTEARFDIPDGRRLTVRYNRFYHGLTGSHVPDIELEFSKAGWQDLVVLFDAKYRLDSSHEQVSFYGMAAPPQDAIGALHRYRDAIVIDGRNQDSELIRPVVKGAALFPLSESESRNFASSKLARALTRYGIGAIPFLPGNSGHLRTWLNGMLQLPHDELASTGPPPPGRLNPDFAWPDEAVGRL